MQPSLITERIRVVSCILTRILHKQLFVRPLSHIREIMPKDLPPPDSTFSRRGTAPTNTTGRDENNDDDDDDDADSDVDDDARRRNL